MQAKFINVFGQWVHPDFDIFQNESHVFLYSVQDAILFDRAKACKIIEDKTIDEVAEEYNRQVDKAWSEPIWYGNEKKQPSGLTDKELVINEKRCRCPSLPCHHYLPDGVKL